jgi:hypothetical protein
MSFVIATPDLVQGAAQDLAGIGSSLAEATATAAGPTTGVAAAAQDEVSIAIASLFGGVGQEFQALSAQAQAFHATFVQTLTTSAGAYAATEAANAEISRSAVTPGPLVQFKENLGGVEAGIAAVAQREETDFEAVRDYFRNLVKANLTVLALLTTPRVRVR